MPTIRWIYGTSYDFFISLLVLHHAADFGLRPYWAAGVRQRLTIPHREILERVTSYARTPIEWISSLPGSKDALPVLKRASELDPVERFKVLTMSPDSPGELMDILHQVSARRGGTDAQKNFILHELGLKNKFIKPSGVDRFLQDWKNVEASSEEYLTALYEYHDVFFRDEETRINPIVRTALEQARGLSARLNTSDLIGKLIHGVHFEDIDSIKQWTLIPSYWSTPFIFHLDQPGGKTLIVYGCRPELQEVAPGAESADSLVNSLKALADPTRLLILRHLSGLALTPTELSRLLRLRPPTVIHHLNMLRLAGLVTVLVSESGEKRYRGRPEALKDVFLSLGSFIDKQD